jgi:hypothetical protein
MILLESAAGIATGYEFDGRVFAILALNVQNSFLSTSGAYSFSYPVGNGVSLHGVKRPGRESNHLATTIAPSLTHEST